MFVIPMGEPPDDKNRSIPYKSANVGEDFIDVSAEDNQDEIIPVDLNLYKRIIKQWLILQEIAGFTILTAVASFAFVIFRSANYFPLVVGVFALAIAFVVMMLMFSWGQLKTLEKIRYFYGLVGVGVAAGVCGHDIMSHWVSKNQQIMTGIIIGLVAIGLFVAFRAVNNYFTRKKRRY